MAPVASDEPRCRNQCPLAAGRTSMAQRVAPRNLVRAVVTQHRSGVSRPQREWLIACVGNGFGGTDGARRRLGWLQFSGWSAVAVPRRPAASAESDRRSLAAARGIVSIPVGLASGKMVGTSLTQSHWLPGRLDMPTSPYRDMTSDRHQLIRSDSAYRILSMSSSLRMMCGVRMIISSLRGLALRWCTRNSGPRRDVREKGNARTVEVFVVSIRPAKTTVCPLRALTVVLAGTLLMFWRNPVVADRAMSEPSAQPGPLGVDLHHDQAIGRDLRRDARGAARPDVLDVLGG